MSVVAAYAKVVKEVLDRKGVEFLQTFDKSQPVERAVELHHRTTLAALRMFRKIVENGKRIHNILAFGVLVLACSNVHPVENNMGTYSILMIVITSFTYLLPLLVRVEASIKTLEEQMHVVKALKAKVHENDRSSALMKFFLQKSQMLLGEVDETYQESHEELPSLVDRVQILYAVISPADSDE